MAWQRSDDARAYDRAEHLQRLLAPGWVVLWGPGSRRFWAFRCGGPRPLVLCSPTARELYEHVRRAAVRPHAQAER